MSAEPGGEVPPGDSDGSNSTMPLAITENTRLELSATLNSPSHHFTHLVHLPAIDGFLLSGEDGQLNVLSTDEARVENTAAYDRPLHAAFNPRHGTLVLTDEAGWVGIRRPDPYGFHALRTQLPVSSDGQSLAQHHLVSIEMSQREGAEWLNYFKSPMPSKEASVFQLCSHLPAIIEKALNEGDAGSGDGASRSLVVQVPWRKLLIPLLCWTHAMESKVGGGGGNTIFSPAFSLLERIRLQALSHDPYGSGATSRASYAVRQRGATAHMRSLPHPTRCRVEKFQLNVEAARRLTFHRWPHADFKWALPPGMAEAGFYHHPVEENDDRVLCFTCNLCLVSWEPSDEPRQEHERHSSTCPYINGANGHNVPLSTTMAHLAPIQCAANLAGGCYQVRGTFTDDADWFVIGSGGSAQVSCLHLDRVVQGPLSFTIAMETFEQQAPKGGVPAAVELTALCCLGNGGEARSLVSRPTISAALVVGVTVTEPLPTTVDEISTPTVDSQDVSSFNVLNAVCAESQKMAAPPQTNSCRNCLLLYHIIELEESESAGDGADKRADKDGSECNKQSHQSGRTRRPTGGGGMGSVKAKFADRKRRRAAAALSVTSDGSESAASPAVGNVDWKKTSDMINTLQGVAEAVSNLPSQGSDVGSMLKDELEKIKTLGASLGAELKSQQSQLDAIASQLLTTAEEAAPAVDGAQGNGEDAPMELGDESQQLPATARNGTAAALATTTPPCCDEEDTSLPEINYAPFTHAVVAMQRIPLPAPFDCATSFRVEHVVANDNHVMVAVNRVGGGQGAHPPISALLAYRRIGRVNMVEEEPSAVVVKELPCGPITKLLLLDVAEGGQRHDSPPQLGLVAVKLANRTAMLIDVSTGGTTPIDVQSEVADIETPNNGYAQQQCTLHVLTTDQVVHTLQIAPLHRPRTKLNAGATPPSDISKLLAIVAEAGSEARMCSLEGLEERLSMRLYDQPVAHLHWLKKVLRDNWLEPSAITEDGGSAIDALWEMTRARLEHGNTPPPILHGTHQWREEKGKRGVTMRKGGALSAFSPFAEPQHESHHCNRTQLVCDFSGECSAHVIELDIGEDGWHSMSHINMELKSTHPALQLSIYAVDADSAHDGKAALAEYNADPAKLREHGVLVKGPLPVKVPDTSSAQFAVQLSPLEVGPTAKSIYILLESAKSTPPSGFDEFEMTEMTQGGPIELIAAAYSYAALPTPEASLTRLLLLNRADLHEAVLRLASEGSDRTSHTQSLDVLLWMQAHGCSLTHPTSSSDVQTLLMNAYGGAPRELAHKWTVLLATEVSRMEPPQLSKWLSAFTSLFAGERNLPQLSRTAGSFHWLCTMLFQLVRASSLSASNEQLLPAINALLAQSSRALLKLGEEWRRKFPGRDDTSSLGSMALVFDERLVDYPSQVLTLGAGVIGCDAYQRPTISVAQPIPTLPTGQQPPAAMITSASVSTHVGGATTAASQTAKPSYSVMPPSAIYQTPSGLTGVPSFSGFPPPIDYYDYGGGDGAPFDDIFYLDDNGGAAEMGGAGGSNALVTTSAAAPGGTYASHTYSNVVHPPPLPPSSTQAQVQIINPGLGMDVYTAPIGYTNVTPTFAAHYHPPILPPSSSSNWSAFNVDKVLKGWSKNQGVKVMASAGAAGPSPSSNTALAPSTACRQTATSALPCREHVAEEIDWKQMILAGNTDPTTPPTNQDKSIQRLLLSPHDHWIGLAEVKPLDFHCAYGSDHMKLLWVETGACATLPTAPNLPSVAVEPQMELDGVKQIGPQRKTTEWEMSKLSADERHRQRCQDYLATRQNSETTSGAIQKSPKHSSHPASKLPTAQVPIAPAHQQPWPIVQLIADRMTAGSRKQVVLDFGRLVLLTDALFPACEYTSQLQVDVWCADEREDGFKLVPATKAISERSIVLTPIEPGVVARYMRLTFTSKQLYDKPCSIPLGRFFGLESPSSWQLVGAINGGMMRDEAGANVEARAAHLSRTLEVARGRYAKSCARFKESWAKAGQPAALLPLYRPLHAQCCQDRLAVHRCLTELERLGHGSAPSADHSWSSAPIDQVRMSATSLMLLLNQIYPLRSIAAGSGERTDDVLMDVDDEGRQQESPLALNAASSLFTAFCLHPSATPAMRWHCCRYLLFYGAETTWWPELFPHLLQAHFTQTNFTGDEGFLLLTHLCTQTPTPSRVAAVVEKLLHFLLEQLSPGGAGEGDGQSTVVSWSLQLLSCLLDVHSPKGGGTVGDGRWAFLLGDIALTSGSGQGGVQQQPMISQPPYSTTSAPPVPFHYKSSALGSATTGSYAFAANKAHYKKLLEQLQKLEAGEAASQAKIEKLKQKLQSLKTLLPKTSVTSMTSVTGMVPSYSGAFSSTPNLTSNMAHLASSGMAQVLSKAMKKKPAYQPPPGFAALIENPLKHQHSSSAPSIQPFQSCGFTGTPNNFVTNASTKPLLELEPELCGRFVAECLRAVGGLTRDGGAAGHKRLPLPTKLLAMKVVEQVAASGPATVNLEEALGKQGFAELLSNVLSEGDAGGSLLKHALLCMLLEMGEAGASYPAEATVDKATPDSSIAWRLFPLSSTESSTTVIKEKPAAAQLAEQLVSPNAIQECALSAVSTIIGGAPLPLASGDKSKSVELERQLRKRIVAGPAMVEVVGCEALLRGRLCQGAFEECRRLSVLKNALGKAALTAADSHGKPKDTRARFAIDANASPPTSACPSNNLHSAFTALHSLMVERFPPPQLQIDGADERAGIEVGFPERALDFYWRLHSQVPVQLRARSPIPAASKECVRALLSLCSHYPLMDEMLWCYALRLLNYSLQQQSVSLVRELEGCEELNHTLVRYLLQPGRGGFAAYASGGAGMGPAVDEHFLLFTQLLLYSPSSRLMERVLDVVCEVLPSAAMQWDAMDVMVGFTEKLLAEAPHLTDHCDDAKVAALHSALLAHTRELVAARVKRDPAASVRAGSLLAGTNSSSSGGGINVCFHHAADTDELNSSSAGRELIDFSIDEQLSAPSSSSAGGSEEAAKTKSTVGSPTWLHKALSTSAIPCGGFDADPNGSAARCVGYERRHRGGGFGSGRAAQHAHSLCMGREGIETVIGNLMKLTSTWMLAKPGISRHVLENNHSAVHDAIDTLFNSRIAANQDATAINFDQWRVTSLADLTLYTLLLLAHSIGEEDGLRTLLKLVIYRLRQRHGMASLHQSKTSRGGMGDELPLELSGPIALLLGRMLDEKRMRDVFIELGGHLLIAEQLQRSITVCTSSPLWPASTSSSFPALQRQLHSVMASQRGEDGPPPYMCSSHTSAVNYAPLCQLSSSSPSAYQLQLLTSAMPASRRTASRQPQWTYHFQPQQHWVDVVFQLPHPVLVTDVVVKPHLPALSSAPSALQVELSANASQSDWMPACPLMTTVGLCKVRVPIKSGDGESGVAARAVRLRLKRPLESATLQLQQVSILGHSSINFGSSAAHQRRVLVEWLAIFNRVCSALPVWSYAPRLPAALTHLFLQEPNSRETCSLLHSVLLNVDSAGEEGKEAQSVVKLVVHHVLSGRPTCHESLGLSLAELLLVLCTEGDKATTRQKQLVEGVREAVSSAQRDGIEAELLPTLLWTSACVLWANCSDETPLRYDTLTLCLESGAKAMREIAAISLSTRASATPAAWFLCALLRATPHLAGELLAFYEQSHHQSPSSAEAHATATVFKAIGCAFQSLPAVDYLLEQQLLAKWLQRGLELSREPATDRDDGSGEELASLVDCFKQMAVMRPVVHYLESAEGGRFLAQLLRRFTATSVSSDTDALSKSVVGLVKKCVAAGGNVHRQRTARLLCELLKIFPGEGDLPPTLRSVIHELVLVDERIVVKVAHPALTAAPNEAGTATTTLKSGPSSASSTKSVEGLMLHPAYGCRNSDRVVELSLYTKCRELLPVDVAARLKSAGARRGRSRTHDDAPWATSAYGTGGNADYYGYYVYDDDDLYPAPGDEYWHSGMPHSITYTGGGGGGFQSSSAPPQQSASAPGGESPTGESTVALLYCEALSSTRPVDEEWTLAELLERVQLAQTASSSVSHIWSVSKDALEGRFSMSLQLGVTSQSGSVDTADWGTPPLDYSTPTVSTLQHFAREGGLLELARHFPIHKAIERLARSGDALIARVGRIAPAQLQWTSPQWGFAGVGPSTSSASSKKTPLLVEQVKEQKCALEAAVTAVLAEMGQTTQSGAGSRRRSMTTVTTMPPQPEPEPQPLAATMEEGGGESAESVINTLLNEVQHLQSVVMQGDADPLLPTVSEEDEAMDYSDGGGETPQVLYAGQPMPAAAIDMTDDAEVGGELGGGVSAAQNDFEWLDWPPLPPPGMSAATTTGNTTTYHFVSYVPADAVGPDGSVPLSTLLSGLAGTVSAGGQMVVNARAPDEAGSSKALQPYVLLVLSLFLRLDGYAELMVMRDRTKAKQLISAAFGTTDEVSSKGAQSTDTPLELRPSYTRPTFNTTPPGGAKRKRSSEDVKKKRLGFKSTKSFSIDASSSAAKMGKGKKYGVPKHHGKYLQSTSAIPAIPFDPFGGEMQLQQSAAGASTTSTSAALPLFPFKVFSGLLSDNGGRQLRSEALESGVMSVVLECLSHFAHQSPEEGESGSTMGRVMRRVLEAEGRLEALRNSVNQMASSGVGLGAAGATQLPPATTTTTVASVPSTSTQSTMSQQQQQNYWAKGTGFGHGTTQQQWNITQHEAKKRWDEEMVVAILDILCAYTTVDSGADGAEFAELLAGSCLAKTVHAQLLNDSVLDISKHAHVCESVVSVVLALALKSISSTGDDHDGDDVGGQQPLFRVLAYAGSGTGSAESPRLLGQLKQLSQTIDIYLSRLNSGGGGVSEAGADAESDGEERLERLSKLSKEAAAAIEQKLGVMAAHGLAGHTESGATQSTEETAQGGQLVLSDALYCSEMKPLQFDTIPFNFPSTSSSTAAAAAAGAPQPVAVPYHYSTSLTAVGQSGGVKRSRRLAQEIVTLNSSLPLTLSSSVFARSADERLDVMKMMITGPADTPYANGCFEFDVYFPPDFPQQPMQINLETTGNHSVRFNPNLYDDGKVCLSILNTWRGRPEERWNPESSSLLQVIVSIQSLILVNDPYFNEPGYERWRGTPAGTQASREYDANIRQQTVRWAMTETLRHPPKAFEEVVRRHFWLKRDEICEQVEAWIAEMQSFVDANKSDSSSGVAAATSSRTFSSYLSGLKKNYAQLKEEFAKMKPPSGLERLHSKRFPSTAEGADAKRNVGSDKVGGKRKSPEQHHSLGGESGLDALFTPAESVSTMEGEIGDYAPGLIPDPHTFIPHDLDAPDADADPPETPLDYLTEEDKSQATTEEGDDPEPQNHMQWEPGDW